MSKPLTGDARAWPLTAADLQGLARLGVDASLGITDIVEAMHHTVLARPWPWARGQAGGQHQRTGGITGAVYGAVRATTRGVGWGLDKGLARLARLARAEAAAPADDLAADTATGPSVGREAWLAALNGVWGDHLANTGNPLAITTRWRVAGRALSAVGTGWGTQLPQATGRVLVLAHGLCMNDLQFTRHGHHHGTGLQALGYTPVHLHYNSGRHVWQNGQDLVRLMDQLLAHWPVPVSEIVLLGHSMGGLVLRSACLQADAARAAAHGGAAHPWRDRLRAMVCLGTPHHGAPLERGGHLVDRVLAFSPYAAPLARLGGSRSAGITDLRFGRVQPDRLPTARARAAALAEGQPGHSTAVDCRPPAPWPAGLPVYLVAATTAAQAQSLHSETLGDGLVPLASALGQHARRAMHLGVPPSHQQVVTSANHWDLLDHPEVAAQLQRWLG